MASRRRFVYRSPNEDEYIFNNLVNYPDWAKATLTPQELAIFKTQNSIRLYVNNATGDQKKLLLSKANIASVTLYMDLNKEQPLNLKNFSDLQKLILGKDRQKAIDQIREENAYAVSSREVISAAYLIAQNVNTPYWFVNQNARRVYSAVDEVRMRGLKNYNGSTETAQLKELERCRDVCANFYLASLRSEQYIRIQKRIGMLEMRIITLLFINRDMYLEKRTIANNLFDHKPKEVYASLGRLVRGGFIDINAPAKSYTIAEMGIILINDVLDRLTQQALTL